MLSCVAFYKYTVILCMGLGVWIIFTSAVNQLHYTPFWNKPADG